MGQRMQRKISRRRFGVRSAESSPRARALDTATVERKKYDFSMLELFADDALGWQTEAVSIKAE
jgi:hypothetical protein